MVSTIVPMDMELLSNVSAPLLVFHKPCLISRVVKVRQETYRFRYVMGVQLEILALAQVVIFLRSTDFVYAFLCKPCSLQTCWGQIVRDNQ
jgi:hypothetical protein